MENHIKTLILGHARTLFGQEIDEQLIQFLQANLSSNYLYFKLIRLILNKFHYQ